MPHEVLLDQICNAVKEGFAVRLHTIGDAAIRLCLDCIEEAQKRHGKVDLRHALEHIENIHADDLKRFAQLGVVASMQPLHLTYDIDGVVELLGEERSKLMWAMKSLRKAGAVLASGSDFPVVEFNPVKGVYAAVARQTELGYPHGGWNMAESLSVAEVLSAYTFGSAYLEKHENRIGTLEPGKLADIAVLDRNLFNVDKKEILEAKVVLTVSDGAVVYKA